MTTDQFQWDVFLAHAGDDAAAAEELYTLLSPTARTFLDTQCLMLGDDWDIKLVEAQRSSRTTVVLVSDRTPGAYYLREEIAQAIAFARENPQSHRVVPVYLASQVGDVPYGLRLKHGIDLGTAGGFHEVANQLIRLVRHLNGVVDGTSQQVVNKVGDLSFESGIYISRIINPPLTDQRPEVTTLWLSSRGPRTYVVDSITIQHQPGNLYGRTPVTGAQPLDAEYSFAYSQGQLATHALNPALVLAPDTTREVSCNIRFDPEGYFGTGGASLHVALNYHTLDDKSGRLMLVNPPRTVLLLARMLGEAVRADTYEWSPVILRSCVRPYVVTPHGTQRGVGDDGEDQLLMHVPLDALYIQYNLEEWLDGRKSYTLGAARLALNERLQAKTLASHVVTLIREGEELGFDLAGGWASCPAGGALRDAFAMKNRPELALTALCVRHILNPTADLVELILDPRLFSTCQELLHSERSRPSGWVKKGDHIVWLGGVQTTFSDGLNHVAGALGVFPVGRWASAVLALARLLGRGDLFDLVNRRRDQLAPEELTQADEYCRQEMDTGASPRTSLIEYSRWRGSAKRAVRKRSAMRSTTRKAADEQAEQERARYRKPQRRERTKGE